MSFLKNNINNVANHITDSSQLMSLKAEADSSLHIPICSFALLQAIRNICEFATP